MAKLQIKEIAKAQHMNQNQLAKQSGVTLQLLNRYWNNNTQRVSLEHLTMIAKALGVKAGELIVDDEDSSQKSA